MTINMVVLLMVVNSSTLGMIGVVFRKFDAYNDTGKHYKGSRLG